MVRISAWACLSGNAFAQAASHKVVVRIAICELLRRGREGQKDVGLGRILHRFWQNADDRIRTLIELDLPAQHRRIAAEVPLPEAVVQHRYRIAAGLALIFKVDAAEQPPEPAGH